jgi:hypothetical protein
MVGDRETDIECGRAAGMFTVLLDDSGAKLTEADVSVRSLSELLYLL